MLAALLALLLVVAFAAVQSVTLGAMAAADWDIDVAGEIGVRDALQLSLMQVAGIAVALAMVASGVSSWRGIGLRAGPGSVTRGGRALLPVGVLVIVPSLAYAAASSDSIVDPQLGPARAAAFVLLAVLIAANEELWFRGLVVDLLGGRARPVLVIILSAVLFGAPHYAGTSATLLNSIAVALAVGVPFAAVRLRHQSLLPLIAWHAVIDIWAFLHTASVVAEGDPTTAELAAGLFLPSLIAIAYLAWYLRAARHPARHA